MSNWNQPADVSETIFLCETKRKISDRNVSVEISGTEFLDGTKTLTAAQAVILTAYLTDYQMNNEAKLQSVLTTIGNIGTFAESKENSSFDFFRLQISIRSNSAVQCRMYRTSARTFLDQQQRVDPTQNSSLSEQFSVERHDHPSLRCTSFFSSNRTNFDFFIQSFLPELIQFCQTAPPKSLLRLYALNLLTNMSVLEYLHDEYMQNIAELSALIATVWTSNDEALAMGKTLVNLSTNKSNVENLFKLTVKLGDRSLFFANRIVLCRTLS